MAIRTPRGYERNRPPYNELCEGVRPNSQALPRKAYTGLPYVRIDELHHDPIVIDAGTLVGIVTGSATVGAGTIVPAVMGTGVGDSTALTGVGATNVWGLPSSTFTISCGKVKPLGVCYQPIYSFYLETLYTNYKRTHSMSFVTDYVIEIPATNAEEVAIANGDRVMLGTGKSYGSDTPSTYSAAKKAGRYASLNSSVDDWMHRVVGVCLRRFLLGVNGTPTAGMTLEAAIAAGDFTLDSSANKEFADLAMIQTVPGLGLSGSGTLGVPAYFLDAADDGSGNFWGLTILIRI